jgi:uncharacterized membrane protein
MKRFLFIFVAALVLALSQAQPALALQDTSTYEVPLVFQIALLGFATYWITEGIKIIYPELSGFGPKLAALLVAAFLAELTRMINLFAPPTYWALLTDLLILAAGWLTANGFKRVEKNIRSALMARSALAR